MRPFGSLPRPISRFERPRTSWTRRLFLAGRLRFGFLFIWMVVAGLAFAGLRAVGREYGYLYSTRERVRLWDKLPDADSASALMAIYGNDSQLPEVIIARHAAEPNDAEPQFVALLRDPIWGARARRVENGNFDFALRHLATTWNYERYEAFLEACQNGKALNSVQRYRLETCRRQAAKGMMKALPASDEETRALCTEIEAILTRPSPMSAPWHRFLVGACEQRQVLLMGEVKKAAYRRQQLALLRQIVLEVQLGGLESQVTPAAHLLAQQTLSQVLTELEHPGPDFQDGLSVLACCKVLVPKLEYPELAARLNSEQLAALNRFAGVGAGPRG
ncbi:MAG: hypothetical protein KF760_21155 [Candidatus Eremiobacteraeota bacterium]|nr:hypothetical protein [Candidatus Eremiobacteraeota bacterium]MCW5867295.1 hypothetical protein [Candidatus Eremiobacteraeota bacterium]